MSLVLPTFSGFVQPASGGGGAFANTLSGSFDGSDDYLNIGAVSSLSSATEASISWWGKKTGNNMQVGSADATHKGFWVNWHSDNNLYFQAQDGNYSYAYASFTNDNAWHHFVVTYDGGANVQKIYVDGTDLNASMGAGTVPNALDSSTGSNFQIGTPFTHWYTEGFMDEVALFDSALSASDVTAIYNSGVPADLSSLSPVGWWRMGDGTGDTDLGGGTPASGDTIGTVVDQGSGGNNGTNPNGALYSSTVPS